MLISQPVLKYTMENPPKSIVISIDYLAMTHILLNASYEEMRKILGDSEALMFFRLAADSVKSTSLFPKDMGSLRAMMAVFDYSFEESVEGDRATFRMRCPHAARIHQYLGKEAAFCPMSQVVLATVRAEHPNSIIEKMRLEPGGSSFVLNIQD